MKVDNALLHASGTAVDLNVLLSLSPGQAMEAEQISIFSLDNVFLSRISP